MDAPTTYIPKLELWTHQKKGLNHLLANRNFALLMEMRTGKTATILAEFGALEATGKAKSLLVVAPAGVYLTWVDDAQKHLSDDLKRRTKIFAWSAQGGVKAAREQEAFMVYEGPRILLVNAEALSVVPRARELCITFLSQSQAMLVMDESTWMKNPKAKRTIFAINKLKPLAARRRILSGLPNPQGPLDLYSQFYFLDPYILGYPSFTQFKVRYGVMRPVPFGPRGQIIQVVVGYRDLDDIHRKIAPYSYRVKLEDCYDMPAKVYMRREVTMTTEQQRIYRQIKDFATASLGNEEHVTSTMVITQLLRLHQVLCGHTMSDNGVEIDISENRTAALLEQLEDVPENEKAIIWCSYDADVKKVATALAKTYNQDLRYVDQNGNEKIKEPTWPDDPVVARFWGGNRSTREEEEKRFKTDPKCRFMVATAAAGGRGRTWDIANLNIYYSNTPNLEHRLQSEERPQAKGKTVPVAYVDLICRGTIEEKIIKALREKLNLSSIITGDDYKEWLI
jgi:SNF2 family DNA or RNA helicase